MAESLPSEALFIVDASGYLYRSYHAIRPMTNKQGMSTNALFGFIRSLEKLVKDFSPSFLVVVFDGPNNIRKRKAIYQEYKAHRVAMPEDLRTQMQQARDYCKMRGFHFLDVEGEEADDVMGSVSEWSCKAFSKTYLCTSDKDMAQLVNNCIFLLNTFKDNLVLDPKGVENAYGVPPNRIVDLLALTGDASDNIPGISGIGPKTAIALLEAYPSLEKLLENSQDIPGKKGQMLIEGKESALISKQLVTISTTVPCPQDKGFYKIGPQDIAGLRNFYKEMGFASLLETLVAANTQEKEQDSSLSYRLINSEEELEQTLCFLQEYQEICIDTETTNTHPRFAKLVGVSFSVKEKEAFYIPLNGDIAREVVVQKLKSLFHSPRSFFGHNCKYDMIALRSEGIHMRKISFDTIIASSLIHSNQRHHSLDFLSQQYFEKRKIPISDLIGKGKNEITMEQVPLDQVCAYACEDADYTFRLKQVLEKEIQKAGLDPLLQKIELPLVSVLAEMEWRGIYVDKECLKKQEAFVNSRLQTLSEIIYKDAGERFNLNSPKQLAAILFDKLHIPSPKKIKTGYSTNADVLELLKPKYPIAQHLLDYRTLEKLRSTYIESLPQQIHPKTLRIHTTFNQFVTATGRLSSQDPNLQNIPKRSEEGRAIREAFCPEKKGWVFLSADYSQIELRLLAHFSSDKVLIQAFKEGRDIHAQTAAKIFGKAIEEVTSQERAAAKTVNFGIIYGQGPFGLSQTLGISQGEAKEFIAKYFLTFPSIKGFIEEAKDLARRDFCAYTFTGRRRELPEMGSTNFSLKTQAERLAVNTPLQGGAADLIKKAMIAIQQELQSSLYQAKMLLQIHDELIFEMPREEMDIVGALVKEKMETAHKFKVPLIVNLAVGNNWKEC